MPDRFYHAGPWSGTITLDGDEARHLVRVLRKQPGDRVELFDGRGGSASAIVSAVDKRTVELSLEEVRPPVPESQPRITIAAACPKGDRLRWLIEKATELGVDRFIPLSTVRSVVAPGPGKLAKLEQTVIAACKQSGRNRLMRIEEVCPLEQLHERVDSRGVMLIGDPAGEPIVSVLQRLSAGREAISEYTAVIGPEGGFTDEEMQALRDQGGIPVTTAAHVLRIETAALAIAGTLAAWLGIARK
jgi:16S rRNA (uracil1498-N3)-methyltransferase